MDSEEYGKEAKLDRDYDSLTDKQKSVVDAIAEMGLDARTTDVANRAECDMSYPSMIKRQFPHIIEERIEFHQTKSPSAGKYHFGPNAKLDRSFGSLTDKQRRAVHAIVKHGPDPDPQRAGADAGVSASYIGYVEKHFPHIINDRLGTQRIAADGSGETFTIELSEAEAWQAVRELTDDLSNKVFRQLHSQ